MKEINKGDILYSAWGYDQTNIYFYKIVKRTEKTVWLQRIKTKHIKSAGFMREYVIPDTTNKIDSIIQRRISYYQDEILIRITSYMYAYLWDGKEKVQTFYA